MRYNLEQLGPIGFQDLAAVLAMRVFGSGVQVMGSGPDGGRDMYHRGALVWARTAEQVGEVWDGYTVFQVKHKQQLGRTSSDDLTWLWGQIRGELEKWADPASGRNPVPNYLLFITNVALTPLQDNGGHDRINTAIENYLAELADASRDLDDGAERKAKLARMRTLRAWRVWDENQIQALLREHADVRHAFPGFLSAADVFANLAQITDSLPLDQLEPGLRAHARTTLMGEGTIYFDEAGSGDGTGIPVHEVAIDLPITVGDPAERSSVVRYVLDRGEHILRPKLTTHTGPRHLVVTGAPGNGKTTISKFLVQAYRAAMLNGAADLSSEHRSVIAGMDAALHRMGRALPHHRRWAMRVDLAEYAQHHTLSDDSTLIRYLAERVSKRSDLGNVTANALASWMRQWPWFLVLDGLDEVTEPAVRKRLIERVVEFVTNADALNCDVLVVLTTRPVGYAENIAPTQFERVDLDYLDPAEAVRYGTLATRVRLRNDLDRIEKIVGQLSNAAEDESLRNLLRTPLQVLILTIILGSAGQLAPDRYSLFWGYYETVFRRERDKQQIGLQRILREHGQQIQQLHEQVGFELQARSESGDRSYAALTRQELEDLTWHILDDAGFKPSGNDADLLAKILDAATQRLVLIAPRPSHGYGFDVRSLQELMAAKYLTTGPLDAVTARLRIAAPSPHWRNTWIFAAGSLFAIPQDHQHQALIELVETVDEHADERLGDIVPIGPRLALDLIDDGMTRSLPKWRNRLINQALRILNEPIPPDLPAVARVLIRFADTDDDQRRLIADGLRTALSGTTTTRQNTTRLQSLVAPIADEVQAKADTRGLSGVRAEPGTPAPLAPSDSWPDFDDEIATYPARDNTTSGVLQAAASAVRHIQRDGRASDHDVQAITAALTTHDATSALAAGLRHVAPQTPKLVAALRDQVLPPIHRATLAERLRLDSRT